MSVYLPKNAKTYVMDFELYGQRVKRSTGETSKRKAQAVENDAKAELRERRKQFGLVPIPTYWEALEYYLKLRNTSEQRSNGAAARDRANHARFVEYFGENTLIDAISSSSIAQYARQRLDGGKSGNGIAASTVKRELNDLKAVLNRAVEICPGYQTPTFPVLKDNPGRIRYLSDEEEAALMSVLPDWLKDVVVFALNTGVRKQDILDLKWCDVIWVNNRASAVRISKPKSNKPYSIPVNNRLESMLLRLSPNFTESGHVFRASHGGPIRDMKRAWFKAVNEAELQDFRFHDLRHTFASRLVMRGVGLKQVQELMGHASIDMTLRYAHLAPSALSEAVSVLDN